MVKELWESLSIDYLGNMYFFFLTFRRKMNNKDLVRERIDHKKTNVEEEVKIPVVCALTHEESSAQLSNEEV